MSGMIKMKLPYTTTTQPSGGLEPQCVKGSGKIVIANYTISNHALKSGKIISS